MDALLQQYLGFGGSGALEALQAVFRDIHWLLPILLATPIDLAAQIVSPVYDLMSLLGLLT